jgi:iron complex transport system substrate-binding protein
MRRTMKVFLMGLFFSFVLLLITLPSKAQDDGIHVGVVIQGPGGQPQTYCVTLAGENPTGADAIQATGLDVITESSSRGQTVCRIDSVGCTLPDENCFCQCEGGPTCAYWSYFRLTDQDTWAYSPIGAASTKLTNGDVEGWWWRDSGNPESKPLPVIPFETICGEQTSTFPRTVIDGMGRDVVIEAPPQRIASVTLGSDEILLSLVGPERLLGVTYFAKDSAISNVAGQLDTIPHTDLSGDSEYLISLDADLVILAAYNNPAVLDQLLDAAVPVFVLAEFNTLDEIRTNIRLLGQVTGEEQSAEALIAEMDERLEVVQKAIAGQEPVRVLYYEPGGITYGPGSTVDEIITLAGGQNVIADADLGPYPLVDAEFVLAADPDVILLGGWFAGQTDPIAAFTSDPVFKTLRAVQDGRVIPINDAHMTNVSHYIALGVEDVAHALYPDAFEDPTDD